MMRFKLGEHARIAYSKNPRAQSMVGSEVVVDAVGPWPAHASIPGLWDTYRCRVDYVARYLNGPFAGGCTAAQDDQLIKLADPDGEVIEEAEEVTA